MKLLLTLCLGFQIAFAQSDRPLQDRIDSIVNAKMQEYEMVGLSIGVVSDNGIFYTKGYGTRQLNTEKAVSENTIFHTASVSKLFTAVAVVQLLKEKKISLSTPITKIVPSLNYTDEKVSQISIEELLNHTSGLPDIYNYEWKSNRQEESSLRDYFKKKKLKTRTEPGEVYAYSNLGYDLLGLVVEELSKMSFEDYVKQTILIPTGMEKSDFRHFLIPEVLRTRPHTKSRTSGEISERPVYPYNREHAPSSTLNASSQELSLWMIHFLKELNTNKLYQKMLANSTKSNEHIGLGFQLSELNGFKAVGHYGGDRGFRSVLFMLPKKGVGIVLLANIDYNEDFRHELSLAITKVMLETTASKK